MLALTAWRLGDRERWSELVRRNESWLSPFASVAPGPALGWRSGPEDAARESISWTAIVRAQERRNRTGEALGWILRVPSEGLTPDEQHRPERWRPAGQLTVTSITRGASMSGTLGYWIDRDLAGRGLMSAAVRTAAKYALGPGGLHRLEAVIHPENAASIGVVRRCGFRSEGVRSKALHLSGGWQDHLVFALTSELISEQTGAKSN